jgi:hypothetical protein
LKYLRRLKSLNTSPTNWAASAMPSTPGDFRTVGENNWRATPTQQLEYDNYVEKQP